MKVYSALYNDFAHLDKLGETQVVHSPSEMRKKNSILILHGGQDISPSIYKHKVSKYTHASIVPSGRDIAEVALAKHAIENNIPIFGICRGAQLMCALSGGSLIQHTSGHVHGHHLVETSEGKHLSTTSCHHQMMNLKGIDNELLAWSITNLSKYYIGQDEDLEVDKEPEVVLFPQTKTLAIQGHPEWMKDDSPFVKYCIKTLKERLL